MSKFGFCLGRVLLLLSCWAALLSGASALPNNVQIQSDHPIAGPDGKTCLAVDRSRRIDLARPAVQPRSGRPAKPLTDTYFAIVIAPCAALPAEYPSSWTFTDTREMRITVDGASYCLSARLMANFVPLLDPYLKAFGADQPGSSFAYLAKDLRPNGIPNLERLRRTSNLVAASCGQKEGYDFWHYDDQNGMLSTSADTDDLGARGSLCLTIHADWSVKPTRFQAMMPVGLYVCPPGATRGTRNNVISQQRWKLSSGLELLPTYKVADPREYFDGAGGLPIVGPMGRCLTGEPATALVVTSDCDGRIEQQWRSSGHQIRLGSTADCLTRTREGPATLKPCTQSPEQAWDYVVADPTPNPRWQGGDVYARIYPAGNSALCLVVRLDPFVDPMQQRNPVAIAGCGTVLPRQTSWFRTERIKTISLAIVRVADDDGSNAAMGTATEDAVKKSAVGYAANLSHHFLSLGVRFVFDPETGYRQLNSSAANRIGNGSPFLQPESREPNLALAPLVGHQFYGRMPTVVVGKAGGGASWGAYLEFDPARNIIPIERKPSVTPKTFDQLSRDKAGLRMASTLIREAAVSASWFSSSHYAHEAGHYFGLYHTFSPDPYADTPEDTKGGDFWKEMGVTVCGNPRSVTVEGKTFTPDRINNQGYFGCLFGRSSNAFSPMQLGYMNWMLEHQLNRYPLVACQPLAAYDANRLECESSESLLICQQNAAFFKRTGGPNLICEPGGNHSRTMARYLRTPAVRHLLQGTGAGRAVLTQLLGAQSRTKVNFETLAVALIGNRNLAVTVALNTRFAELEAALKGKTPGSSEAAFSVSSQPLAPPVIRMIEGFAPTVFTEGFITNLPALLEP